MHGKPLLFRCGADKRHFHGSRLADPLAPIGWVGEGMGKKGLKPARSLKQRHATAAVVPVRRRDGGQQHALVRVAQQVALAPHHAAGRAEAALTGDAHAARARGLGIDDGRGRTCFASRSLAIGHSQCVSEAPEHAGGANRLNRDARSLTAEIRAGDSAKRRQS